MLAWPATDEHFARSEENIKGKTLKITKATTTEILYFLEVMTSVILYKHREIIGLIKGAR